MAELDKSIEALPEHLRERTRAVAALPRSVPAAARFVLYWMRTALRAEENPALEVAKIWAAELQLPLLVYQGLDERYDYASDRHHRFILEGARDVQAELATAGISYVFHLARPGHRQPHLRNLAAAAAVVVTEEMPVDPPRHFLERLGQRTAAPLVAVDTACIVPMQLTSRAITRAFEFRSATEKLRRVRLPRLWPELSVAVRSLPPEWLAEEFALPTLDLQTADLASLVAECEIDHLVPPVCDTIGGSVAGYDRWNAFRDRGLRRYDRQRNDALAAGVSRLSAYLHYGMVSPLRIAREAAEIRSSGSEKYLDELLIWRELAYHFCFHRPDHDQVSALPDWALATLRQHRVDPRPALYDWETLARGATADPLWNAAQKSLLLNGELHNNVRMTWGKALLNWTADPESALRLLIDLNHRFALDGRDPASYGGILWCLGQFDRPFEPSQPIIGTVRPRPTREHARRLDPDQYLAEVTRPRFDPVLRVAIVGAGISGLIAARTLRDHGLQVVVLEKSRGAGGRMATRHLDDSGSFDHGAPCFQATDARFLRYLESWSRRGLVAHWPNQPERRVQLAAGKTSPLPKLPPEFVAVPQMNSICKHLAGGLDIRKQVRVGAIREADGRWELLDDSEQSLGQFDVVISTAPAEQTAELFAQHPAIAEAAGQVRMQLAWALLAAWPEPFAWNWELAAIDESWLRIAARNQTKPGRSRDREQLVLHANSTWTEAHWEHPPEEVAAAMLKEFQRVLGVDLPTPQTLVAHRWKFATPLNPGQERCLAAAGDRLLACGDWTSGPGVEAAFLAGAAAAGRVLNRLPRAAIGSAVPAQTWLF